MPLSSLSTESTGRSPSASRFSSPVLTQPTPNGIHLLQSLYRDRDRDHAMSACTALPSILVIVCSVDVTTDAWVLDCSSCVHILQSCIQGYHQIWPHAPSNKFYKFIRFYEILQVYMGNTCRYLLLTNHITVFVTTMILIIITQLPGIYGNVNRPCPWATPSDSGRFTAINPYHNYNIDF